MKKSVKKILYGVLMLTALLLAVPAQAMAKDIVVVLDPGHDIHDAGARRVWNGVTYAEEVLNLKIAKYAKQELEKYNGVKVYLTHTTNNVDMDRKVRVQYAKNKKADALVSIHLNVSGYGNVSGALAMVPSASGYPYTEASKARALAKAILTQLQSYAGTTNRGFQYDDELGIILFGMKKASEVGPGGYKGVGTYRLPSMIIEHCFLDNYSDCINYLSTEAKIKRLGVADATGIAKYFKLKKKGSSTVVAKNGWQTENGKRCYYVNGTKVKSKWQLISKKYYYFDANGYLKTGPFKIGNGMYLTDKNGVRQKGFVKYKGNQYYVNSQGKMYTKWRTYKNNKYYFSPTNGRAVKGLKTISGEKYFFHKTTGVMQTRWVTIAKGKKMYFKSTDGKGLRMCWLKQSGKYYFFDKNGYAILGKTVRINGKSYKFNASGVCLNR